MSDIFTTGEPAYFNEKTTFFAGIQAEVTGNLIGDVQGNIFAPDICIFESGPIIIGALEPTTTPDQTLQVSGGGYFSESVGIGTTNPIQALDVYGNVYLHNNIGIGTINPKSKLHVIGGAEISGIVTVGSGPYKITFDGVNGIISGITSVSFTGSSGFVGGPIIIGAGSSTGTSLQNLQVTGGTYISGSVGIGTSNPKVSLDLNTKTDAINLPQGTTIQRPASPTQGMLRYNTTLQSLEWYAADWTTIPGIVSATGGNVITEINVGVSSYRVHQFTSSGTFSVLDGGLVEYLVIGGGGGGGGRFYAGGGGAGGMASGEFTVLSNTNYSVIVGSGGSGGLADYVKGIPGEPSSFGDIFAPGGGGGGSYDQSGATPYHMGEIGGCGGGASGYAYAYNLYANGTHGYRGGIGGAYGGGGGGGLGGPGENGNLDIGGRGGPGRTFTITGVATTLGGGGGGARGNSTGIGASGGIGGGGNGASYIGGIAGMGSTNTGGGGGGACYNVAIGGTGGSGIVILRYKIYNNQLS